MRRATLAIAILLAAWSVADLRSEAAAAKTEYELRTALGRHFNDPIAKEALSDLTHRNFKDVRSDVVSTITASERFSGGQPASASPDNTNAAQEASEIKKNPLYRDAAGTKRESWLSKVLDKIAEWFENLFKSPGPGPDVPIGTFPWLTAVLWTLIVIGVVALLVFAVLNIRSVSMRKRTGGGGLLEEDEPDLSADEWLSRADQLLAKKKYREATRALYIAALMRFDEHGVARFQRAGTNWEHLRRIEASPAYPIECAFRIATRLFDRVWYGHLDVNESSVQSMRGHYVAARDALAGRAK